jgi:hypothetical protein
MSGKPTDLLAYEYLPSITDSLRCAPQNNVPMFNWAFLDDSNAEGPTKSNILTGEKQLAAAIIMRFFAGAEYNV